MRTNMETVLEYREKITTFYVLINLIRLKIEQLFVLEVN